MTASDESLTVSAQAQVPAAATLPVPPAPGEPDDTSVSTLNPEGLSKVSPRYIWLIVFAQFGVFVAFITPLAISLAIRVQQLAPGQEQFLGFITGAGAAAVLVTNPFLGVLSDRTRTRLGRRRPWMIGGMLLGVVSLFVMATAPSILVLGAGWILAQLTWGQVLANLQISTADRLPESQRGKVAGLAGFATQVAPVFGVVIAGSFASNNLLLFIVPGLVGVLAVSLFVLLVNEKSSKGMVFTDKLTVGSVLAKYVYNPRSYPDFSWNWLGRFLFYFGLTLNTTFTAFFIAAKLGITVEEVAGIIATLSLGGIAATTLGAIGGGFLSDKLKRRRMFVAASGIIFAAGALTMALAPGLPVLIAGSVLTSLGIGIFAAVDQALLLDVLPERDTNAGRFMGITSLATSIPQAVAPLIAPLFLAIGANASGDKNYTLLFIVAGACTILGGLAALRVKSVR
ncbi:MFS transporter [Arthrobacter sp. MDB2-24]